MLMATVYVSRLLLSCCPRRIIPRPRCVRRRCPVPSRSGLHQTGSPHDCIGRSTGKTTEVPHGLGKRVGTVRADIRRDAAVKGGAEIHGDAGVTEIDTGPFRSLFDPGHGKFAFHLICHHLDTRGTERRDTPATAPTKTTLSAKLNGWSFADWFSFDIGGVIFRGGTPATRQPLASAITKSPT